MVVVDGGRFDHRPEREHLVGGEVFDQAEVEEGDRAVIVEQVVAGMWVAVERAHPVQAAEHEPEDHLAGSVTVGLGALHQFVPAEPLGEFRGEHVHRRQFWNDLGDPDEGMVAVVVGERPLVSGLEFVVDFLGDAQLDLIDHLGTVTFLDFGLVKHFTTDEMLTFGSMVKAAAVDHDHAEFRRIVEGAGMLRPDAPVSTEAVGDYFSHFYDTVRTDSEMTWTREYANSIVRHTFDRTSPISQYATVPRAFVFIQRINLGLYALLGELGATGNYRRIASELWPFVDGPPSTELGRAEAQWRAGHW